MGDNPQTWTRLRSTRHVKYWCAYHFVWVPKYRRDVLINGVREYAREVLSQILKELGCEPLALEVMPDHVHVFTICPPRHSPSYVARYLKGKSARKILQKFPELRARVKSGKLWSRSYFVATVGNVTADVVRKYVEEQWKHEED
ncbi:IS200/IS605 family transposase [Infirmifilum lucidum]|uniref:IS200/IS605 family transposase n=1 Tax=Infirmifilum lucidum TaxID=2776706 RepID=A0A7L9FHN2_9CREN|nr:IS200/IS605 family transposase [Infirmifilum lucidum]QOJ79310.1 IS200/IS605 family transposase [Infirmifilum lucidum]